VGELRAATAAAEVIAIDTNLVVRFLTRDEAVQAARARALIGGGSVLVLQTVILETEWVLRTRYRFDRAAIGRGLRQVLGLPGITVEHPETVARALDLHDHGFDFADRCISRPAGRRKPLRPSIRRCGAGRGAMPDLMPVVAP
jgi:predicted nucleic-acid-binding protein